MNAREGYSEQSLPRKLNFGNVFCLSDHSLLICDVNSFFIWDAKERKISEVKVTDFPLDVNSSNNISKLSNANNMFLFEHITRDPEHNDFETVITTLYEGATKIRVMPSKLNHPFLLANGSIIGIDEDNELVECDPSRKGVRGIFEFDKKITFFYGLNHNQFLVMDEANILSFYELKENTFAKINKEASVFGIESIQDLDSDHFVCSIFNNPGKNNNKLKDCNTKLQLWNKESFSCIREIDIQGFRIKNLKQLPDAVAQTPTLVGCDGRSIFIVDFERNKVNIIDMGYHLSDFNIAENGKLVIMLTDGLQSNLLIQIEPNLVKELLNQPGQGVFQTSIDILKQPTAPALPIIPEEKEVSNCTQKPPAFFSYSVNNTTSSTDNSKNKAISSLGLLMSETLTDEESFNQLLASLPNRTLESFKMAIQKKDQEDQRRMNMSPKVK